jgi:hypothetical protein
MRLLSRGHDDCNIQLVGFGFEDDSGDEDLNLVIIPAPGTLFVTRFGTYTAALCSLLPSSFHP